MFTINFIIQFIDKYFKILLFILIFIILSLFIYNFKILNRESVGFSNKEKEILLSQYNEERFKEKNNLNMINVNKKIEEKNNLIDSDKENKENKETENKDVFEKVTVLNEKRKKETVEIKDFPYIPETKVEENIVYKENKSLLNKIFNFINGNKKSEIKADTSELMMLAKIIHAEAGDQPYEGKVAVGAVVLNRVRDSRFPSTIKAVIESPGQFEPVSNGSYQRAIPNESDIKAAKDALSGIDPVNGALYFYAPTLTSNRWHETLTYIKTIGGHKFFK